MNAEPSLRAHLDYFARRAPLVAEHVIRVADCRIRIHTSDRALFEMTRHYFRSFRTTDATEPMDITVSVHEMPTPELDLDFVVHPPGPGKTRIKDEYVNFVDGRLLRKRQTGVHMLFGPAGNAVVGACRQNINQVVNFINNRFIQWQVDRGYLLTHAAGVAQGDRGLLLAGVSGRGKSTLAMHLLSEGMDFVSNDRLLVKRSPDGLEALGVPKFPRVNPGTIVHNTHLHPLLPSEQRAQLAGMSRTQLWELEQKHDVDVVELFGPDRFRIRTDLQGLFILSWQRGDEPFRAVPADLSARRDLLQALMKPVGAHYYAGLDAVEPDASPTRYLRELDACPCHELTGGIDFAAAVEACRAALA